ncbi:MAG TPA: hypothetical protein VN176_13655 [Verrucomicrobiae bacterium]|nr:hypothetical protein [Verrucomicrobiae bacterium]
MEIRKQSQFDGITNRRAIVRRTLFLLTLAAVTAGLQAAPEQKSHAVREQTTFSETEDFRHPVAVPPDVVKALLKIDYVREMLDSATDSEKRDPAQLLVAAEIHLNDLHHTDLIVMGHYPLGGADHYWYWVVRSARQNPKIVLWAHCNSLELMSSRTNGYRDIRTDWAVAAVEVTDVYKFNGNAYKLWKTRSRPNR